MGCDIHVYTEMKLDDGTWWCCDHFTPNQYYIPSEDGDDSEEVEGPWRVVPIYSDRYYELFATLAGVRNYNDTKPIDEARGLPADVSKHVREEADRWGDDGHSFSWLLASELFAYKAKKPFYKVSGYVSPTDAFYLDELGKIPEEWCRYTSDESWVRREWLVPYSVLDNLIKAIKERMTEVYWIWDFLDDGEREKRILDKANQFRIVFWFDN